MAASTLFVFSIFSALLFTAEPLSRNDAATEAADSPTRLRLQLRFLETKVYLLESSIDEKNRELREKDERIRRMEEIIQGKSDRNALFKSEIELVQGSESLDSMEFTDTLHVQNVEEIVKQVREDIILQNTKKDELESRAGVAEQKIQELKLKVEDVHEGWLSVLHVVAVHISHVQTYIATYWNECGRPAMDVVIEKALQMKAEVKSSAQLTIITIKSKLIPDLKKKSLDIIAYLGPKVQLLAEKTVDIYHSSKNSVAPIVFKAQEIVDPHIQVAKKFTEPYIAQVTMVIDESTMVTRTHIANIHIALKPYTKQVIHICRKFITSASSYHYELQETLKNNKLTQSLATIELAWLVATALLALPALVMLKLYSALFSLYCAEERPISMFIVPMHFTHVAGSNVLILTSEGHEVKSFPLYLNPDFSNLKVVCWSGHSCLSKDYLSCVYGRNGFGSQAYHIKGISLRFFLWT